MINSIALSLPVLNYLLDVFLLTIKIFLGSFLPVIIACFILNFLANAQNRCLYALGGWNAWMLTAWIGTPIHEISHLLAAVIAKHKIQDVKLFKPDKTTGTIGYVMHSYNQNSFYQSTLGNAIIAIAPFFGGALAIYFLSTFLFPDFSLFGPSVPQLSFIGIDSLKDSASFSKFLNSHFEFFRYLFKTFFSPSMLLSWKLYAFLFIMFGIANHLSPSGADFQNFWTPLSMFLFAVFLLNLVIYNLVKDADRIISFISNYTLKLMPILYLAIFVSVIWLLLTYLLYGLLGLFRSR